MADKPGHDGEASTTSLRCVLGYRRVLRRRRGGLLLIVGCFLLRPLQLVHDLLQRSSSALQVLHLPARGIELLLMVGGEFPDRFLQEIDIALQTTGPPL